MKELDLVLKYTAGKEHLLVDALSGKDKYSLDPTEEQDFIPQSIDATEDYIEPYDSSIFMNNLSISTVPEEYTIVSRDCITFKQTDCDCNQCTYHDGSFGHHPSCPYLDNENDRDYEDYYYIKEEEIQWDKDSVSTIPKDILDGYEFDPHPHIVEQDQLNGYCHISTPADATSSVTNDDNIPAIITDIVNDAWEPCKQFCKQHNMDCHNYYYRLHGSMHQNGHWYFPTTRYSICRRYRHGYLDYTLAEAVLLEE